MKKAIALLTALVVLGGAKLLTTLAPTAGIEVVGYSPQEIRDLGLSITEPTTGLDVVGEGELVILRAMLDEEATAYAWTITGPDTSGVVLDSTDTEMTSFRPDVVGTYTVELTATGATGSATATKVITAAHYVGAGAFGVTAQASEGHCAACHTSQTAKWLETTHATYFARAINGEVNENYNETCIECHTVGYNEAPSADNAGFDDMAEALGWEFPATLEVGNWEEMLTEYPELANLANIQCENCHGPGGQHFGLKAGIDLTLEEDVCGVCHDSEPYYLTSAQWNNSAHSAGGIGFAAARDGCADCHSGYGYIAKVDPQSDLAHTTGFAKISCAVCHDPHPPDDITTADVHMLRGVDGVELLNGVTVTDGGMGQQCMDCHKSRRPADAYVADRFESKSYAHFGPHYAPQADMLQGTNVVTFGQTLSNSTHLQVVENSCVTCHMTEAPPEGETGHLTMGGHTWNMSVATDGEEKDLVDACVDCHGPMESFDDLEARADHDGDGTIEAATAEVKGLMEQVAAMLPTDDPGHGEPDATWSHTEVAALYNYKMVYYDHSYGIHNYQFTVDLLQVTKSALEFGVLAAGQIVAIEDVPNDQGKQVQVVWTRFGGDAESATPIDKYYVWRLDDVDLEDDAAAKNVRVFTSLADVPADEEVGEAILKVNEQVWTLVSENGVPASQLDMYSAVVPTLYDSTAADGAMWSTFTVSGHTAEPSINVWAEADSAYSVDNLEPSVPGGIAASVQDNRVVLKWDQLPDQDVDYVAIYRSTARGFSPVGRQPIATLANTNEFVDTAVMSGETYYYRLAAFDFAGNRSPFSAEVMAGTATGIEGLAGIPTEFELQQNYPNPFNPSTSISFGLPEAARVQIVVYDISGREVGTVVDRQMTAGRYQVQWHADHLASGVYIYRMETAGFVSTKTMMLLK